MDPAAASAVPQLTHPEASGPSSSKPTDNGFQTSMVDFDMSSFDTDFELDTSIFIVGKGDLLHPPSHDATPHPGLTSKLSARPSIKRRMGRSMIIDRPRSWLIPGSKSSSKEPTSDVKQSENDNPKKQLETIEPSPPPSSKDERHAPRSSSTAESLANFARFSWISSRSRSPSPRRRQTFDKPLPKPPTPQPVERLVRSATTSQLALPKRLQVVTNMNNLPDRATWSADGAKPAPRPFQRASTYLSKLKTKRSSFLLGADSTESDRSCASSADSIGDRTPNSNRTSESRSTYGDHNDNTPTTNESSIGFTPKPKDPLWSSLKTLDIEIKGFSTKTTAQQVTKIQDVLLPFLRNTRSHKSTKFLDIEDIERRAEILNKWWSSLLEILHGHGQDQQAIPGVNRPTLLEAATLLMMRPEWRQTTSYMKPLSERSAVDQSIPRPSTSSSQTSQNVMVAESAAHNVRVMFVTNLVQQMSYIVNKMSLRHAPLSLVSFAGKTCAYAFFFAPGVADVLVRLWGLTPELIKCTAAEFAVRRMTADEDDDILGLFPPELRAFGWTSVRTAWNSLKQIPKMPLPVARIPWTGPWVARWKGRDTDLLFIFCKYFHIILDEFMPPGLPLSEKARSPAFILMHAQLLSLIDSTIHRQPFVEQTFDTPLVDVINAVDASALPIPLPAGGRVKGMGENRLVVLLKDFLSDEAPEATDARHTFGESFAAILKGAAAQTSLFDSAACFTLCDFLEEILIAYGEFETPTARYVNWNFWIEVCKKMSQSMNTMTEIRMLSFLYTVWEAIAKEERRKAALCLDWLLTEEMFNSLFNNWCPMVRAYYHRLLCWRICRYTGHTSETDRSIFVAASDRLNSNWSHYLYLKDNASALGRVPPSTAPMSPAAAKKFIILRQQVPTLQSGLVVGFDTFAKSPLRLDLPESDALEANDIGKGDSKKRWSLLGKVLSLSSVNAVAFSPVDMSPKTQPTNTAPGLRRELADAAPLVPQAPEQVRSNKETNKPAKTDSDSGGSSPVYDEQKYVFKFVLGWQQNSGPAREKVLARPHLPNVTQMGLDSTTRAGATSKNAGSTVDASARAQSPPETPRPGGHPYGAQQATGVSLTSTVEEWLMKTPTSGSRSLVTDPQSSSAPAGSLTKIRQVAMCDAYPAKPIKPVGVFAKNTVYCGRALAEWSQAVAECNIFNERRQEEGVERLCDLEVPTLSVEGFRKVSA